MDYEVNCQIKDCSCKRPATPKPHKWAKEIKAWADGAEIQILRDPKKDWMDIDEPNWTYFCSYRVKPEPKPDKIKYAYAFIEGCELAVNDSPVGVFEANIKLAFDGETKELKSVEIIK